MQPQMDTVEGLVNRYMNEELALPEMQRGYVWRSSQVRDLVDSLYRDYPAGSILLWDTSTVPELRRAAVTDDEASMLRQPLLLLDGQQRITSLATVLTGRPIRVKEGRKVNEKNVDIYFNTQHPENESENDGEAGDLQVGDAVEAKWEDGEYYLGTITHIVDKIYSIEYEDGNLGDTYDVRALSEKSKKDLFFQAKNRSIATDHNWISVTKLFKEGVGSILRELNIGYDAPEYSKISTRLERLYNTKKTYFPVQVIKDKSYKDVTEIFNRVNSAGTKLRGSDLALAQLTAIWPGSMKILEAFAEKCADEKFHIDENFLVRCIVCIATKQALFSQISALRRNKLEESWKLTKRGIEDTINFLKNKGFVDTSNALPSLNLMIPLLVYATRNKLEDTEEKSNGFLFWFFNATLWARYSGTVETKLTQDLGTLNQDKPWIALTEAMWQGVGKNRILTAEYVRGKGSGNPLFSMMYIRARSKSAQDYETGRAVAYSNFGSKNKIEFDHIFPRSKLNNQLPTTYDDAQKKRIINEVANLAFLTKEGNLIKTNDDPEKYFPRIVEKYG